MNIVSKIDNNNLYDFYDYVENQIQLIVTYFLYNIRTGLMLIE
jgi:hypothetical protein